MLSEWAVLTDEDVFALNYYDPGEIDVRLSSGSRLSIVLETGYPAAASDELTLRLDGPARFALRLRIPEWSTDTRVAINGDAVGSPVPGRNLQLDLLWQDGDVIMITFDMKMRFLVGDERVGHQASI